MSGNLERDCRKMLRFRNKTDPRLRVRFDVNNLWASAEECIRHVTALPHQVYAIKESLRAGDLAGFERVGVESWRSYYNGERPHNTLGNLSPREFAVLAEIAE